MLVVSEKSNFTPAPEGLHPAICVGVIDLGIQVTPFGNKPQVVFLWELDCLRDDGQRFTLSRKFTPSLSKKASLRNFLESWRGRAFTKEELAGFELKTVLGKPCQLMVQHAQSADGRVYANITAVVPAPKGTAITPQSDPLYYDQDDPNTEALAQLPEWIQRLIENAIPPQEKPQFSYAAEPRDFNDELTF